MEENWLITAVFLIFAISTICFSVADKQIAYALRIIATALIVILFTGWLCASTINYTAF